MNTNILYIFIILVITVFSVILHELAHGAVAYWLGDRTAKDAGRLSLNPLKHIDPYMSVLVPVILYMLNAPVFGGAKPVPVNYYNLKGKEWGMALVAASGPFTNFLIALVSFLIGHFTGFLYGSGGEIPAFIFTNLVLVNLGFMLFNLIPVPPLDGSRILYAISPDSVRNLLASMERYGVIAIYMLILLFGEVFSSLMINGTNGILQFFYLLV
ncbi:MAG: site-2 protease family protein [Candidatus Saccharibacteria bacterium]|nr:site-2 protease family protein [Candidatus Saccharibacteria bacterium]